MNETKNHVADTNSLNPALYVGTYGKYNEGSLKGKWVDLTTFDNGKEFIRYCVEELHKDERDPEIMFQDFENFPQYLFSETMSPDGIDEILQWWKEENAEREKDAGNNLRIVDYNEGVSVAVVGDTYPLRKKLKDMGGIFRRHKELGACWVFSAKRREELEKFVANGADVTGNNAKSEPSDKPDKALLEEYVKEMRKVWGDSESMIEYCRKSASRVIRLTNGGLLVFEKPTIETDFCFGYGCQSMTYEEAGESAESARNESYFMSQNLGKFRRSVQALEGKLEDDCHYSGLKAYLFRVSYSSQKEELNVWHYQWMYPSDAEKGKADLNGYKDIMPLSDEDRKLIIAAEKAEIAAFEKRLNTWWKRYGAEKLHVWTYWADE